MTRGKTRWTPGPAGQWWLCWALFILFLLLPGSERSPFSGISFSAKASLLFTATLVLAVATALFRPRQGTGRLPMIVLFAAIVAKLALAPLLVTAGWRGEYATALRTKSLTFKPLTTAWFQHGRVARQYRIDREIDYNGLNFGLSFINEEQPVPEECDFTGFKRDIGQPLLVQWKGHQFLDAPRALSTVISARGNVRVSVDGREIARASHPRDLAVTTGVLPAGLHEIRIRYGKPPDVFPFIRVQPLGNITAHPATADEIRRSDLASRAIDVAGGIALLALAWAFFAAYRPIGTLVLIDLWNDVGKVAAILFFAYFALSGTWSSIPNRHLTVQLGIGDDPLGYEVFARQILRNGLLMVGDSGTAGPYYHYPGYPYVLAAAHALWSDDFTAVQILNYFCAGTLGLLMWGLLRRRLAPSTIVVVLAVLAWFTYRHILKWAHQSFTDNLYVPLVMATVLVSLKAFERRTGGWLFAAGVITAFGAATRPSLMIHVPVMCCAILLYRDFGSIRQRVVRVFQYAGGFLAGVSPFTIRNWIVAHKFVLLVASFVMLPYFMYPPGADVPSFIIGDAPPMFGQALGQAWQVFSAEPGRVLRLEVEKVLFTLGFTTFFDPAGEYPRYFVYFPLLFALALFARRIDRPMRFALLTFAASHLAAMVIAAPWTYGYKTILPLHIIALAGAAFLLPRSVSSRAESRRQAVQPALSPAARPTVSVILPTYREKDSIRACIRDFFATGVVDEVLVINNNAVDGTSEEVAGTGAIEIFERRQGYGSAIQRGLLEAKGDYLVICEPDGTFMASDIHKLLAYGKDFDAVFGSRTSLQMVWRGANMGFFLRWGNWAVAKYLEFLYNAATSFTDVGCTMRLIRREVAEELRDQFRIRGSQFGPEMMILALRAGCRVVQIPVNYLPRVGESAVTGNPAKAFILGLQMIWLITWRRFEHLFMKRQTDELLRHTPPS